MYVVRRQTLNLVDFYGPFKTWEEVKKWITINKIDEAVYKVWRVQPV